MIRNTSPVYNFINDRLADKPAASVKVEVKYFNFSGIPYEKIAVILLSAYLF